MEAKGKVSSAVQNEADVVFLALYPNDSFIGMPLFRVEIQCRNELYRNALKHWYEAGTPVANGRVRYPDIHCATQNQNDIVERVLARVEHGQAHEDHLDWIAHPREICLSKELGHRRGRAHCWLWHKNRVPAFLARAEAANAVLSIINANILLSSKQGAEGVPSAKSSTVASFLHGCF